MKHRIARPVTVLALVAAFAVGAADPAGSTTYQFGNPAKLKRCLSKANKIKDRDARNAKKKKCRKNFG